MIFGLLACNQQHASKLVCCAGKWKERQRIPIQVSPCESCGVQHTYEATRTFLKYFYTGTLGIECVPSFSTGQLTYVHYCVLSLMAVAVARSSACWCSVWQGKYESKALICAKLRNSQGR